jgi:ABC-type sugar transport system permease subunit
VRRDGGRALLLLVLFGVVVFLTAYPTLFMFVSSFETNRPGQAVTWGLDAWRTAFNAAPPYVEQVALLLVICVAMR